MSELHSVALGVPLADELVVTVEDGGAKLQLVARLVALSEGGRVVHKLGQPEWRSVAAAF